MIAGIHFSNNWHTIPQNCPDYTFATKPGILWTTFRYMHTNRPDYTCTTKSGILLQLWRLSLNMTRLFHSGTLHMAITVSTMEISMLYLKCPFCISMRGGGPHVNPFSKLGMTCLCRKGGPFYVQIHAEYSWLAMLLFGLLFPGNLTDTINVRPSRVPG